MRSCLASASVSDIAVGSRGGVDYGIKLASLLTLVASGLAGRLVASTVASLAIYHAAPATRPAVSRGPRLLSVRRESYAHPEQPASEPLTHFVPQPGWRDS